MLKTVIDTVSLLGPLISYSMKFSQISSLIPKEPYPMNINDNDDPIDSSSYLFY